jgi:hypothetical protein
MSQIRSETATTNIQVTKCCRMKQLTQRIIIIIIIIIIGGDGDSSGSSSRFFIWDELSSVSKVCLWSGAPGARLPV